jgi:peptidoglycan/LPS O-acetylase OafA/YrhL
LLFPFCLPILRRSSKKQCMIGVAGCFAALILFEYAVIPALPGSALFFGSNEPIYWKVSPIFNFPIFLMGVFAARIFLFEQGANVRGPNAQAANDHDLIRNNIAATGSTVLLFLMILLFSGGAQIDPRQTPVAVTSLLFMFFIYLTAYSRGPVAALLARPWLVKLGDASYALYILQAPVKTGFQQIWSKVFKISDIDTLQFQVALLVVLVISSLIVNEYFEAPIRKRIQSKARGTVDIIKAA